MTRIAARLTQALAHFAAVRMRRRHPDWSAALIAEHASIIGDGERLLWALGSLRASLSLDDVAYPFALVLSVAAMTLYQWSADESVTTLVVLGLLSLGMGFLRPRWFLLSGSAVGAVVAAVNGFETASGIRPAYEIYAHTAAHDLQWLLLLAPAIACSGAGRQIHLKLSARLR